MFSATVEHVEASTVLRLAGELDLDASGQFDELVSGLLDDGHIRLLVDLGDVGVVDTAGLASIVHARRRATTADGWLVLRGVSPRVQRLLAATGLDGELHLEDRHGRPVAPIAAREAAWT